jgi:hypothetical protein
MYAGFREEGDKCPERKCDGIMFFPKSENCSCHISPPCGSCADIKLTCRDCGYEEIPEPHHWIEVAPGLSMREDAPRPLDSSKIDYRTKLHTASTQICEGVYPEGTTRDQVQAVVDGTFGGRFEYFSEGKFKFIAYTD